MTIKRILLPLTGAAADTAEIALAIPVAKAMEAHLEALHISRAAQLRGAVIESGKYYMQGSTAFPSPGDVAKESAPADDVHEQFASICSANGIPIVNGNETPQATPSATWREAAGTDMGAVAQHAAAFDLVIAASAAVTESTKEIAERSLLETGRPVLLAPSKLNTKLSDPAMVAWDESPQCWHALSAAVPLLKLAESVRLVSVDKNPEQRGASQAEALDYLRCHGVKASAQVIEGLPELKSVGDALLATAADYNTGLLVMGAYSHSRLREILLGGATHHILQTSSTRPVLMAH